MPTKHRYYGKMLVNNFPCRTAICGFCRSFSHGGRDLSLSFHRLVLTAESYTIAYHHRAWAILVQAVHASPICHITGSLQWKMW